MSIRAINYGGGVQSTAMLVLAANGEIDYQTALFCDVGADSENPATIEYVKRYAKPYAHAHGIELVELRRHRRDGTQETLMERIHRSERSIGIPIRIQAAGRFRRNCTKDFKINLIVAELRRRGATAEAPATSAVGISMDEFHRMTTSRIPEQRLDYPLIALRLDRQDCMNIIAREGLPVPPKSSCYFCPFHNQADWSRMAREQPELFAKSVELERLINERLERLGTGPGYLSSAGRPLDEAFTDDGQLALFDDDGATCDIGGYCFS